MRVASSRVITNVAFRPGRNQTIPVFANYRLIAKVCVQVLPFQAKRLNLEEEGEKEAKESNGSVSCIRRGPSVNKWKGGDIAGEMKQGGKRRIPRNNFR